MHPCCALKQVHCTQEKCGVCSKVPVNVINLRCGSCLWAGCPFFCLCDSAASPGIYTCKDLKANTYHMIRVDADTSLWACFSDNDFIDHRGDDQTVLCFCHQPF